MREESELLAEGVTGVESRGWEGRGEGGANVARLDWWIHSGRTQTDGRACIRLPLYTNAAKFIRHTLALRLFAHAYVG